MIFFPRSTPENISSASRLPSLSVSPRNWRALPCFLFYTFLHEEALATLSPCFISPWFPLRLILSRCSLYCRVSIYRRYGVCGGDRHRWGEQVIRHTTVNISLFFNFCHVWWAGLRPIHKPCMGKGERGRRSVSQEGRGNRTKKTQQVLKPQWCVRMRRLLPGSVVFV